MRVASGIRLHAAHNVLFGWSRRTQQVRRTVVVFNARPKVKTRPLIVPVKAGAGASNPATTKSVRTEHVDDDEDDDDDDE